MTLTHGNMILKDRLQGVRMSVMVVLLLASAVVVHGQEATLAEIGQAQVAETAVINDADGEEITAAAGVEATLFDSATGTETTATEVATGQAATETPAKEGNLRPKFSITAGAIYDDNLYLDAANQVSDLEFMIRPFISIGLGDVAAQVESYLTLEYQPTGHVFVENTSESAVDHDVALRTQLRRGKLNTKADARFQSLSGANREVGARVDALAYQALVETAWQATGKIDLGLRAGFENDEYDATDLVDASERYAEFFATYAITGKSRLGFGGRYGTIVSDGAPDQDYSQYFAFAQTDIGEKTTGSVRAGVDRREIGQAMEINPILELALQYRPKEGTQIGATAYSTLSPSALSAGESFVRTGFSLSLRQKLGNRLYGKLEGGFENADYEAEPLVGAARNDDYWFIKSSLGYDFREGLSAEIYYRHSQNSSNQGSFSYDANQIGAAMTFQY